MVMMAVPASIEFFLPRRSPTVKAIMAPKKQSISYIAVTVDSSEVFSGPTRSWRTRKSSATMSR